MNRPVKNLDDGALCQGTASAVPISPLFMIDGEADFSPTTRPAWFSGNSDARLKASSTYSRFSGSRPKPFSPAAFFSQYLRTHASQLLPAAVSRPEKARAAMWE